MPIEKLKKRMTKAYGDIIPSATRAKLSSGLQKVRSKGRNLDWSQIFKIGLYTLAVVFILGTVFVAYISKDLPDPNKLSTRTVAESTKIYDRTGTHLLYESYQDEKRTLVTIDKISPYMQKAVIAVEDKNFYEHHGIRPLSILRATFNNLIGRKTGSGGASTLTQQLIKNTIVGSERRGFAGLYRKIKEAILALRLERKYSKQEILQSYLNEVSFGSTNYGIESASQSYFRKSASDLTIAEAATLAAMIQAPSRYLNNPDSLRNRRDVVVRLMYEQGYINEEQKNEAQNVALRIYPSSNLKVAPHFVLNIEQTLADQYGKQLVETGGLKVITTLDYDKQLLAERIVKEQGDKFAVEANAKNAALVAIDPKTAQIIAYVGNRDYNNLEIDGRYDVPRQGLRQPGSSLKPFIYTYAFTKGYTPETVLYDIAVNFDLRAGAKPFMPHNYDGLDHGLVTFRKALQGSLNVPAVKVLYLVGVNNFVEFAKTFGYTSFNNPDLSMVLGSAEVSLLEHTNAYATLANNGVFNKTVSILKVSDVKGETLFEWKPTEGTKVLEPEYAATIANVLSDNAARAYVFGAVNNLTLPGRPVATKTGTTNDTTDVWTMGYVPSLATGVWVGNKNRVPMKGTSNKLAGLIWNQFMRAALVSTTPENFPTPPPNTAEKAVLRGADGGIKLPINKLNGKIATSTTPSALIETRTYLPSHDILYYINKDDPRGPFPANPTDDPQYQSWENALTVYVETQKQKGNILVLSDPPTEYDTGGDPTLSPKISITTPSENSSVSGKSITVESSATAPRGVTQVIYSFDGKEVGSANTPPFNLTFELSRIIKGTHTLSATAFDDAGNAGSTSITLNVSADTDNPSVDWVDNNPLDLTGADFPRDMYVKTYRFTDTKDIKIYLGSGRKRLIWTFVPGEDTPDSDNKLFFTWKKSPGVGHQILEAVTTAKNGTSESSLLDIDVK